MLLNFIREKGIPSALMNFTLISGARSVSSAALIKNARASGCRHFAYTPRVVMAAPATQKQAA
jgi:hypothetical protein